MQSNFLCILRARQKGKSRILADSADQHGLNHPYISVDLRNLLKSTIITPPASCVHAKSQLSLQIHINQVIIRNPVEELIVGIDTGFDRSLVDVNFNDVLSWSKPAFFQV